MVTKSSLKIAMLHDWTLPLNEYLDNEDGLPAAIEVIAKSHDIQWYTGISGSPLTFPYRGYKLNFVPTGDILLASLEVQLPDVIISWGGLDRPWNKLIHDRFKGIPKVLLFAGGPRDHIAKSYFQVIVCESQVYIDDFTRLGVTATRGFGTNMQIFRPRGLPKRFDAIYPASLCFHKNIELFCRALQGRGLVVGNHNEPTIVSKVLSLDTALLHRVSSNTLADLINMSRVTVVTAGPEGGAQRVVLESMACGTPVVVMSDHDRCIEFVRESGFGRVVHPVDFEIREVVDDLIANPLDRNIGISYIASKWSESHYAESILSACRTAQSIL